MFLKVDVESGKIYFKKSKDGPEDKFFVHNKSKESHCSKIAFHCILRTVAMDGNISPSVTGLNNYWIDGYDILYIDDPQKRTLASYEVNICGF